VDSAVDELAIRNLIARLAHATDDGELHDYAAMIDTGARWVMPRSDPVLGREAILTAARSRRAAGLVGPGSQTRHFVSTTAVRVEGDNARAVSNWQFLGHSDGQPVLLLAGVYRDAFRRSGAEWLFSERVSVLL
jgi:3-phenylpropionate/cinnamic acid dioxygenase small subunit